jgi:hypothetical protein
MPHEYTRQRQRRDFSLHEAMLSALAEAQSSSENAHKAEEKRKSLIRRIEEYREEAGLQAMPIDGHEPPEHGRQGK